MNVRGALPGLVVMVLIAGAGVLFAFGVREIVPDDLLQGEPYGAVQVDDIELEAQTGLPIVPTAGISEPRWWTTVAPNERIDASLRFASSAPAGEVVADGQAVTLMATFADHAAALEVAQELAAAVGYPEAEAAWLVAAGVSPGNGFEWLGPDASRTPFVQVIDRRLLIDGLAWHETFDAPEEREEEAPAGSLSYRSPLALALEASAVSVLAEGDRGGEGAIAFDMICSGDPDDLTTLEQDLADYMPASGMRPPWVDPPLTLDERAARRTLRLLTTLRAAPFVQDLVRAPEIDRLMGATTEAVEAGDDSRAEAAAQALRRHLVALRAEDLPELGHLADTLDREAMAISLARLAGMEPDVASAETFGASDTSSGPRDGGAVLTVSSEDRRLWLQAGSWLGVAQGLGPMLDYLEANGCDDPWVVFHDFEQVRGD